MCPSSGADDCVVLSPVLVLRLQEGCQNRLAGGVSIEEFIATKLLKMGIRLPETC